MIHKRKVAISISDLVKGFDFLCIRSQNLILQNINEAKNHGNLFVGLDYERVKFTLENLYEASSVLLWADHSLEEMQKIVKYFEIVQRFSFFDYEKDMLLIDRLVNFGKMCVLEELNSGFIKKEVA